MIKLERITPDNWRNNLAVREDQRNFVADSTCILARAYAYREQGSKAFMIYNDDTPVGMALIYEEPDYEEYEFSQFFIDARYQGRGFGLEAARQIVDMLREDGKYEKVCLCYIDGDDAARNLYEKLGFRHVEFEDEEEDDECPEEIIMQLKLR